MVGEVATGAAAVKYALENEVDVVLLDIRMPDGDGLTPWDGSSSTSPTCRS